MSQNDSKPDLNLKIFKKGPIRRAKSALASKTERIYHDSSSGASSEQGAGVVPQDHARPRTRAYVDGSPDTSETSTTMSNVSISSSINRFRNDFDELKCKMQIFGESLSLCKCIASDFKNRLKFMEKRLQNLERREVFHRSQSNYSAIIQKNQKLSTKCLKETKKLQMCGNEEEMREVAAKICKNYLHGAWKSVEATSLEFNRISGGLSNFLYYVALPDDVKFHAKELPDSPDGCDKDKGLLVRRDSLNIPDEPRKVLLRIYGQVHGERAMDAIVTESVIFTLLSERRLGPKLYGVFSGGRIEEYIPARALLTKELSEPALSMKIAEKMAAIHSMDIPLSKEPSWLWKTMGKWMKTVRDERLNGTVKTKNEEEEHIIRQLKIVDFEKEIDWLKKYIATVESPCVFCHNDLQEGNILILEDQPPVTEEENSAYAQQTYAYSDIERDKTLSAVAFDDANTSDSMSSRISESGEPRLVLIDFEYCAYNYRGFDIANHFQEWGLDYTNPQHPFYYENQENCPTLEQKEIFIKEYLKYYNMNLSEEKQHPPTIDDINRLLNEVEAFALASHLFWSLWSIVNASKSQIPFGYWEYAITRLETYQRLKQEVVKKDKFGISSKRKIHEVDI